jgi:hypothetical protein
MVAYLDFNDFEEEQSNFIWIRPNFVLFQMSRGPGKRLDENHLKNRLLGGAFYNEVVANLRLPSDHHSNLRNYACVVLHLRSNKK